jgi:hypothetical protein
LLFCSSFWRSQNLCRLPLCVIARHSGTTPTKSSFWRSQNLRIGSCSFVRHSGAARISVLALALLFVIPAQPESLSFAFVCYSSSFWADFGPESPYFVVVCSLSEPPKLCHPERSGSRPHREPRSRRACGCLFCAVILSASFERERSRRTPTLSQPSTPFSHKTPELRPSCLSFSRVPGAPHLASEMWVPALTHRYIFLLPKTSAKSRVKPLNAPKSP